MKVVIGAGKSEATAGLTSVCPSRAKSLVVLLAEPIPSDRLPKLGENPTLRLDFVKRSAPKTMGCESWIMGDRGRRILSYFVVGCV